MQANESTLPSLPAPMTTDPAAILRSEDKVEAPFTRPEPN